MYVTYYLGILTFCVTNKNIHISFTYAFYTFPTTQPVGVDVRVDGAGVDKNLVHVGGGATQQIGRQTSSQ